MDKDGEYPRCECGRQLCGLDRTYDTCPECDEDLPDEVKLDFDFLPLKKGEKG